MAAVVIIDGNNLLHTVRALGPPGGVGREALIRVIERWAQRTKTEVILVYDGHKPRGSAGRRLSSSVISVRFSKHSIADDVVVDLLEQADDPGRTTAVSDDNLVRVNAERLRCAWRKNADFVAELYPPAGGTAKPAKPAPPERPIPEKPQSVSPEERDAWLAAFDEADEDELDERYS